MYCADDLVKQSEYWSDVLLSRDWSMLEKLWLGNYENTQTDVESLMRISVLSFT